MSHIVFYKPENMGSFFCGEQIRECESGVNRVELRSDDVGSNGRRNSWIGNIALKGQITIRAYCQCVGPGIIKVEETGLSSQTRITG